MSFDRVNRLTLVVAMVLTTASAFGVADSYDQLLRRYEKQIRQQEKRLSGLQASLAEKEREAQRWQKKSDDAKTQWNQAGVAAEKARNVVEGVRVRVQSTRTQAQAAEWSATEHALMAYSSDGQLAAATRELFARKALPLTSDQLSVQSRLPEYLISRLAVFSESAHLEATSAQAQEASLRTEEIRWQNEEQRKTAELDKLRDHQQGLWAKWQEALRKRNALEEEKGQVEQSEKALQVMLQELRDHRDHTLAARQGRRLNTQALSALRGTLPWPVYGRVSQSFGRQYSKELNQLLISNGIKIESRPGQMVRCIQPGKVLFANAFRQYGQLVIIQHTNGLTSVYGGLGQVQAKEGDQLGSLDPVGAISDQGSFYFELRRDEEPVDPLVYLTPNRTSELSLRRKFQ